MPGSVVDASAVAAVLFGEPDAERAAAALGSGDLHAPSLLPYELASVALQKALAHPAKGTAILQALERLDDLRIRWVDVDAAEVARLALRARITAYDAAYFWLAERLGFPLVSLDRRLMSAFRGGPNRKR